MISSTLDRTVTSPRWSGLRRAEGAPLTAGPRRLGDPPPVLPVTLSDRDFMAASVINRNSAVESSDVPAVQLLLVATGSGPPESPWTGIGRLVLEPVRKAALRHVRQCDITNRDHCQTGDAQAQRKRNAKVIQRVTVA